MKGRSKEVGRMGGEGKGYGLFNKKMVIYEAHRNQFQTVVLFYARGQRG